MQDQQWPPDAQTVSPPPPSAPPGTPADGFLARVIAVFAAPGKAMAAVSRSPRWLPAGLLIMAVMALFSLLTMQISGPEQMEVMRETKLGRMMTPEQYQEAYDRSLAPTPAKRVVTALSAAAGSWVALFVSGLIFLLFTKLAGGPGTFKQVMGVVFWSGLISYGLGTLVKLPLVLAKQSVMEVSTGLGALAPADPLALGYQVLNIFDFFAIWSLVVMVSGFQAIHGFARGKAIVVTVLPWLLMSAVMLGIGRLFI